MDPISIKLAEIAAERMVEHLKESILDAYRRGKDRRFEVFVQGLNLTVGSLRPDEQAKFEAYVASRAGQEQLEAYVDKLLFNRSTVAIAALAIFFADSAGRDFDRDFKEQVAYALD